MDKDSSTSENEFTKHTLTEKEGDKKHHHNGNSEGLTDQIEKNPSHNTLVSIQTDTHVERQEQPEEKVKDQVDDHDPSHPIPDTHEEEKDEENDEEKDEEPDFNTVQEESNDNVANSAPRKSSSRKRSAPNHLSHDDDMDTFSVTLEQSSEASSPSGNEPPSKVARHVLITSKRNQSSRSPSSQMLNESSLNGATISATLQLETLDNVATVTAPTVTAAVTSTTDSLNKSDFEMSRVPANTFTHSSISGATTIVDDYEVPESDETYLSIINLETIPHSEPLQKLSPREVCQLEAALQIGDTYSDFSNQYSWQDDWNGNLQLLEKDIILNRDELAKQPNTEPVVLPFCEWVAKLARHSEDFLAVQMLFSFIYHMKGTPPMAQRILAYYLHRPANSVPERLKFVTDALRRISHDPNVLVQDGWTTLKSDVPDGASGGTFLIGRRVIWQKAEAIVIAFVRDEDIGDLWKCMWIDDLDTFDLEADELQDALYAWEKKVGKKKNSRSSSASSTRGVSHSNRFEVNRNFTVDGIEDGIILAKSLNVRAARPWPARIMHVSEMKNLGIISGARSRSSSRNEIHVVFLAPYWNAQRSKSEGSAPAAKDSFSTGPLFEVETIEVSPEAVLKYPYSTESGTLDIDKIRNEFSFLGLPKAAFRRFLDSHRLAMALKAYAQKHNLSSGTANAIEAMSSLTDTHPLSIRTFLFPDALINIPFEYILSKFPDPVERKTGECIDALVEPMMRLDQMLKSIAPPHCWEREPKPIISPVKLNSGLSRIGTALTPEVKPGKVALTIDNFASKTLLEYIHQSSDDHTMRVLKEYLSALVSGLNAMVSETENATTTDMSTRQSRLSSFLTQCLTAKVSKIQKLRRLFNFAHSHFRCYFLVHWRRSDLYTVD